MACAFLPIPVQSRTMLPCMQVWEHVVRGERMKVFHNFDKVTSAHIYCTLCLCACTTAASVHALHALAACYDF